MYHKKQNKKPTYNFSNFIKACKSKNKIVIHSKACEEACTYFNLRTEKIILDFIISGGLENLFFLNTKPWEQNPNKTPIMIDAYEFTSGNKRGYIAYFYNETTKKWFIKSFHLSENMNDQMAQAIKKSELLKKLELEE